MERHIVNWKTVTRKNVAGEDFESELPYIIDGEYRCTLLGQILAMPKKNPISFADAVRMVGEKRIAANEVGRKPGQTHWYTANFVQWISDLGYHIELTGDEFESYITSDKIA